MTNAATGVATRLGAGAAGAVLLGALRIHRPTGLATVCVLRATTGVPCPLCGGTTAFARLGRGHLMGALAANPFAIALALGIVLVPTGIFARLRRAPRPVVWTLVAVVLSASWVWQLGRFGYL